MSLVDALASTKLVLRTVSESALMCSGLVRQRYAREGREGLAGLMRIQN